MTKKIDTKDKKIIYHLATNARMSDSELSKLVQLSKKGVAYRIKRLQKKFIIVGFKSIINLKAIGYQSFVFLLKFNEDIYDNPEILNYFKGHPRLDWVAILSGQWDILAEFVIKDVDDLANLVKEINTKFSTTLNTYHSFCSSQAVKVEHLVKDFYKDLDLEELPRKPRTKNKYTIDKTDQKILHALCEDSSPSYLELAEKLNLTMDIIRYRIKQLQEKEIIVKFIPIISLENLGYVQYLYTITFKNMSPEQIYQVKNRVGQNPHVTYAFFDVLSYSMVFTCAFKDAYAIDHLSRELRKQFSDIIEYQDYHIIKEHIKFNLFPKGLLEEQ